MPTQEEWNDLISQCTWEWKSYNGTYGYEGTATNGKSIFFPASGKYEGSSLGGLNSYAYYWTSSLMDNPDNKSAYSMFFNSSSEPSMSNLLRYRGLCVRGVREK